MIRLDSIQNLDCLNGIVYAVYMQPCRSKIRMFLSFETVIEKSNKQTFVYVIAQTNAKGTTRQQRTITEQEQFVVKKVEIASCIDPETYGLAKSREIKRRPKR